MQKSIIGSKRTKTVYDAYSGLSSSAQCKMSKMSLSTLLSWNQGETQHYDAYSGSSSSAQCKMFKMSLSTLLSWNQGETQHYDVYSGLSSFAVAFKFINSLSSSLSCGSAVVISLVIYEAWVRFGTRMGVRNLTIFEKGGCGYGGTRQLKNY